MTWMSIVRKRMKAASIHEEQHLVGNWIWKKWRSKCDFDGLKWVEAFYGAINKNRRIRRMKEQVGQDTSL